jgi:hypothetical protein
MKLPKMRSLDLEFIHLAVLTHDFAKNVLLFFLVLLFSGWILELGMQRAGAICLCFLSQKTSSV